MRHMERRAFRLGAPGPADSPRRGRRSHTQAHVVAARRIRPGSSISIAVVRLLIASAEARTGRRLALESGGLSPTAGDDRSDAALRLLKVSPEGSRLCRPLR